MHTWATLWQVGTMGLLVDSNADGLPDGSVACLAPLTPEHFTPSLWAAAANLAARLGLETPALHLPIICTPETVAPWQLPIFLTIGGESAAGRLPTAWRAATLLSSLCDDGHAQVRWLMADQQRALWVQAPTADDLAHLLLQLATATIPTPMGAPASAHHTATLDLARLYNSDEGGLFTAGPDGFTAVDTHLQLLLGPATDHATGLAAVDLAARLGLETTGLTLPLVVAADSVPTHVDDNSHLFLVGFPQAKPYTLTSAAEARLHHLSSSTARYLAESYPHLTLASQRSGDEATTLSAVIAHATELLQGHPPLVRLALAETQAARSLYLHTPGAATATDLQRVVFSHQWNPPDGLDDLTRVRTTFFTQVLPTLARNPATSASVVTLFANAPQLARQALAAEVRAALQASNDSRAVQVLPAHKAGLHWLLEQQLPRLRQLPVAHIKLHFREFQPPSSEKRLELPTRWLQELFPADELLCRALGLSAPQIAWQMQPATADEAPVYRIEAYDAQGTLLHQAELMLHCAARLYMAALPAFGWVHPTTGGVIVQGASGTPTTWPLPTDADLFWNFYQDAVLPALRCHLLSVGQGRPTPESEPYFDRLEVHLNLGGPDEPLGLYEEVVSLGEALHEDIYFNTLDYLAALGEAFGGRPIEAGGQVLPLIHDYYAADGTPLTPDRPRAVVTLTAWQIPQHLPEIELTVGDRRDLPQPQAIRLSTLTVMPMGAAITEVGLAVSYATAKEAHFAARVLTRWQALVGAKSGFPANVAITVDYLANDKSVATVALPPAQPRTPLATALIQTDSAVIGPDQLHQELADVATLPGVRIWQVGHSYQGRPGYAIDVTLPLADGQTHVARLKLAMQKPTCFLIARHHANEVSSTTTAFQMVRDFVTQPAQQAWLQRVNLVFLPMANPDGAAAHYQMMAEHPRWKHHAARFNAAGKEISRDQFNPATPFGEARFRQVIWSRWLPDAIVDNHGVPSHEWCQPFAGFTTPPRFPVCYHVVQAMLYGIITFADDPAYPQHREAAEAVRRAVTQAVAATPWLYDRNQFWLQHYHTYGHNWQPALSPVDLHDGMLFFFQGVALHRQPASRRDFAMRYPQLTLLDWITEVPDETAQGAYLQECAAAHYVANQAMIELVAKSAQPMTQVVTQNAEGRVTIGWQRKREIG